MFKKLVTIAACAILMLPAVVMAQTEGPLPCGTEKMVKERMLRDPDYARQIKEHRELMLKLMENPPAELRQQNNIVVPVVIHVMHDYNNGNISREQVLDAMRILNEDFNAASSDLADVDPAFQSIIGNVGIEFRLARLDPNGNCTDGITRTYTPLTSSANDNVKDLIRWDPNKYLNIWVVKTISFGAGGYAYYPCPGPDIDGILVAAGQFGSIGTSSGSTLFRSITHEVGHYLDLPHTWGNSNNPGLASNCNDDDGVADTPNTIGVANFACNTSQITCGSVDNVQNIMDYTMCQIMFTKGQKDRMLAALTLSCRSNLIAQSNLMATGTNDGFTPANCVAKADFNSFQRTICAGSQVKFFDMTYNGEPDTATWQWNWSFPGGTPSVSTERNPTVVYNSPGTYPVTLSVTNPGGVNTRTKAAYVEVSAVFTGLSAPYLEGFESNTFPLHPTDQLKDWDLQNGTTNTWEQTSAASAEGSFSMRIRHQAVPFNRVNSLVTPNIDFSGITSIPRVYFKVAYSEPYLGDPDRLRVYFSTDCGQSWALRYAKAGNALATAPAVAGNFVPTAEQWRQESISLPGSSQNIMLKFESTSGNGSTLYLDAISIGSLISGTEDMVVKNSLQVFPNPNNGQATIRYELLQPSKVSLIITNAIGQQVAKTEAAEQNGLQELDLQTLAGKKLAAGVYIIQLQTAGQVVNQKLIVN